MSQLLPAPPATAGAEPGPSTAASPLPGPAPVLITEHHVAFSTAAAAPVASTRRWPHTTLVAALGRILAGLTPPRPPCPRREPNYFEASRMSRAMDRL